MAGKTFWGLGVLTERSYEVPLGYSLHISHCALAITQSNPKVSMTGMSVLYASLHVSANSASERVAPKAEEFLVVSHLSDPGLKDAMLDLYFAGGQKVYFRVEGKPQIHLSGYLERTS